MSRRNRNLTCGGALVALGLGVFSPGAHADDQIIFPIGPGGAFVTPLDQNGNPILIPPSVFGPLFLGVVGGTIGLIGGPLDAILGFLGGAGLTAAGQLVNKITASYPAPYPAPQDSNVTLNLGDLSNLDLGNLDPGVNVGDLEIGADIAVSLASVDFSDIGAEAVDDAESEGLPFGG